MATRRLRSRSGRTAAIAGLVGAALVLAGCGSGGSSAGGGSSKTRGTTITVALHYPAPPASTLAAFTKQSGIKVKWVYVDWDSLQTKISAAATAKTYFADATDVDWSRVGQLGKLDWFYPMEDYVNTSALKSDMPQLASFTAGNHVVGIPFDASYMVTTVNKKMFKQAGITTMPTTIDQYTKDLQQVRSKGVVKYPLNIPFAAAEGLSTYWYETTRAFGGSLLDDHDQPLFTSPDSAGYKAAQWMVDAMRTGLVPPGNINVTDSQGEQTLMGKGAVASTFSDYSGLVGVLYNDKSQSSVAGDVGYLKTPVASGTATNLSNPDGIGIPKQAKYPKAAAEFIKWFTAANTQEQFAGLQGSGGTWSAFTLPSHLSAVQKMSTAGRLAGGQTLAELLKTSQPVFSHGAPTWYPKFSNAVYTNLHAAATGSKSVDQAIKAISDATKSFSSGS